MSPVPPAMSRMVWGEGVEEDVEGRMPGFMERTKWSFQRRWV